MAIFGKTRAMLGKVIRMIVARISIRMKGSA
jgi:hypothetical protein